MPEGGRWTPRAPLAELRSHGATAVYEGRIYVFGGGGPGFASMNSVEVYDPKADSWGAARPMPTTRSGAMAVTVDDRIYVMGGGFKQPNGKFRFFSTVEIYHPLSDRWENGPSLLHVHDYPAAALREGRLYILGGHHPEGTEGGPQTDPGFDVCEMLEPKVGHPPGRPAGWKEIAPLTVPRFALSAAVFRGRLLALAGVAFSPEGFLNYDLVEAYDPEKNEWRPDPALTLPWRAAAAGAVVAGGRLYLCGGYSTDFVHDRSARYLPSRRMWERLGSIGEPRAAMGAAVVDGVIYLIGGWGVDGRTPLRSVVAYNTTEGS